MKTLQLNDAQAFYDISSVDPRAKYNATVAGVVAQLGGAGHSRLRACVDVCKLLITLLESVREATTPAVAHVGLLDYITAAVHTRRYVLSLATLVGETRLQKMVDTIAEVMLMHTSDVAVQRAGVDAMFLTSVVASRKPQQAIAAALAHHGADHAVAAVLSIAAVRYTYRRLSSDELARTIGVQLARVVVAHARNHMHVSMYALGALCNVTPRLCQAELMDLRAVDGLVDAAVSVCDAYEATHGQEMFIKMSRALVRYVGSQPAVDTSRVQLPAKRMRCS